MATPGAACGRPPLADLPPTRTAIKRGWPACKILKGTNPGDIPVERATRFDLAINRKTATALEINLAPSIFLRADRVIE